MLYYLFGFLESKYELVGASVFGFITFRAAMALVTSLLISIFFGKKIISFLRRKQLGESIRDLGLEGQLEKKGTPTMGGVIIIMATLIPVLLFAKLHNVYVVMLIVTTVWMGFIGFLDDYLKIKKENKDGLAGKFKVVGQVILGLFVGTVMYFHSGVTIKNKRMDASNTERVVSQEVTSLFTAEVKSMKTTVPFFKNNEFNYSKPLEWINPSWVRYSWIIFIPVVVFIVTAVSNGANLTDGIDGLAAGSSAIIVITLAVLAWISGNIVFSDYLHIMYIPRVGEISVFLSAFAGALVGFLWYNTYPAQVFMGDTGSLTIGGVIAVIAIAIRKELMIPVLCGVFFIETLSVVLQVSYFKYTKKKNGEGKRIFLMSPLHHHYQKKGIHESKIVTRFWILGIFLAVLSIVTLKVR